MKLEFEPNETGTGLKAGDLYKIVVRYAKTPATKNEMYKALTEAYK